MQLPVASTRCQPASKLCATCCSQISSHSQRRVAGRERGHVGENHLHASRAGWRGRGSRGCTRMRSMGDWLTAYCSGEGGGGDRCEVDFGLFALVASLICRHSWMRRLWHLAAAAATICSTPHCVELDMCPMHYLPLPLSTYPSPASPSWQLGQSKAHSSIRQREGARS